MHHLDGFPSRKNKLVETLLIYTDSDVIRVFTSIESNCELFALANPPFEQFCRNNLLGIDGYIYFFYRSNPSFRVIPCIRAHP